MVHRLVCLDINARMTSPPGFGRQFFVLGTVYKSSSKSNLAADGLVSTCFLGIGLNSPLRVTAYTVIPAHGIRHNVKRDGICFEKKNHTCPHISAIPRHSASATMCYRQVQCQLHSMCGHEEPKSHFKVDCQNFRCRYSSLHPQNCGGCPDSCRQWLDRAQTVVTQIVNSRCYHCSL